MRENKKRAPSAFRTKKNRILLSALAVLVVAAVTVAAVLLIRHALAGNSVPPTPEQEIYVFGDFEYTSLPDGTYEIVGYRGDGDVINVPDAITGHSVSSVAEGVFSGVSARQVYLGPLLKYVGANAFSECAYLEEVSATGALTVGDYAFYNCNQLRSVKLGSSTAAVGAYAFAGCEKLSEFSLPPATETVGEGAFSYCESLADVTFGDALTAVGPAAFRYCVSLAEVSLGDSVQTVGASAFYGCDALTRVSLGRALTSLGTDAFGGCDALAEITVDPGNSRYTSEGGALVDVEGGTVLLFPPASAIASYTVPAYVTRIGDYAFRNCLSLTEVTLPDGLSEIGSYAFYFCDNLASVNIPDSVRRIGGLAFTRTAYLSSLSEEFTVVGDGVLLHYTPQRVDGALVDTEYATVVRRDVTVGGGTVNRIVGVDLTLPENVRFVSSAFATCNDILSVTLPAGVEAVSDYGFYHATYLEEVRFAPGGALRSIGANAFENCQVLSSVTLPEGLQEVGASLFLDCYALRFVTLPGTLRALSPYMFSECTSLSEVGFAEGLSEIGAYAFSITPALSEISFPTTLTTIGDYAFASSGLTAFHLPDSLTGAGEYILMECTELRYVSLGRGLREVPVGLCMGCTALTDVDFGGVSAISADAFYDCSALFSLTLPASVRSLGAYCFAYCTSLSALRVEGTLTEIPDRAFYAAGALSDFTLAPSVQKVGEYAFYGCYSLPQQDLSSLRSVGEYAFYGCSAFTRADISSLCFSVPAGVFANCSGLTEVKFHPSVQVIGYSAFLNCTALTSVALPEECTTLSGHSFAGCASLNEIAWNGKITAVGSRAFFYCGSLRSVTLPATVRTVGEGAFASCASLQYASLPDGAELGEELFRDCTALTGCRLPAGIIKIPDRSFNGCTALTSFVLPEGLLSVGAHAFDGCTALARLTLPVSVAAIGTDAFADCEALSELLYDGTDDDFLRITVNEGNDWLIVVWVNSR